MNSLHGSCIVFLLSVSCILCVEVSDELKELLAMLHKTCQEITGVAEDVITSAQGGNFIEDPKLKCYIKCLMMEMAVMEDDGEVDVEAGVGLVPEESKDKLEPVVRKCYTLVGSDPCDTAFQIFKCYYDNATEDFVLP